MLPYEDNKKPNEVQTALMKELIEIHDGAWVRIIHRLIRHVSLCMAQADMLQCQYKLVSGRFISKYNTSNYG